MKHEKSVILILCILLLLSGCADNKVTKEKFANDASQVTFDIEYHRGGRNQRPENTMYSFVYAIENGATTIECDMQLAGDDTIVLSHQPYLCSDFVRDENGNYVSEEPRLDLRTMTVEEIRQYDVAKIDPNSDYYAGHGTTQVTLEHASIPTLDELFALVKEYGNGIQINIEAKIYHDVSSDSRACIQTDPKKFIELFYKKVKEYGLEKQIILQSFDWQALVEMKKIDPDIRVSALWSQQPSWGRSDEYLRPYEEGASPYLAGLDIDDFNGDAVKAAASLGFDIVSPYCKELTIDQVEEAHTLGMKVIPWNANTKEQMEAMYAMGVDGIITDNGPLLREVLLSHGETLFVQRALKDLPYHLE